MKFLENWSYFLMGSYLEQPGFSTKSLENLSYCRVGTQLGHVGPPHEVPQEIELVFRKGK